MDNSEHVIIPRTENTIKCKSTHHYLSNTLTRSDINSELDELDREEFFRLKKVQGKKQRDTAAQDEEMRIRREAKEAAAAGKDKGSDKENEGSGDILGESEDADVIF